MSETPTKPPTHEEDASTTTGTATVERPKSRKDPRPAPPRVDCMPPWKVLLHNDDVNDMGYVIETILELTILNRHVAIQRMLEAHTRGLTMLLTTHREHAELLQEQFTSRKLIVTIEAD